MIDLRIEVMIEPEGAQHPGSRVLKLPGVRPRAQSFTKRETLDWQRRFARAVEETGMFTPEPIDEPLRIDWLAVRSRPGRLSRKADPDGPVWCPTKPDLDNITENILDALAQPRLKDRGPFLADDNLVVASTGLKVFAAKGAPPCLIVRIRSASLFDPYAIADAFDLLPTPIQQPLRGTP